MSEVETIEGQFRPVEGRIAIVAARFNDLIVDRLVEGCLDTLRRHQFAGDRVRLVRVPGCFELPLVAKKVASSGDYAAVIALGAVIRGETAHFEHVAGQCASGVAVASRETGIPVIFGVLTTETVDQAMERSGIKLGNHGASAAITALEMIDLMRQL